MEFCIARTLEEYERHVSADDREAQRKLDERKEKFLLEREKERRRPMFELMRDLERFEANVMPGRRWGTSGRPATASNRVVPFDSTRVPDGASPLHGGSGVRVGGIVVEYNSTAIPSGEGTKRGGSPPRQTFVITRPRSAPIQRMKSPRCAETCRSGDPADLKRPADENVAVVSSPPHPLHPPPHCEVRKHSVAEFLGLETAQDGKPLATASRPVSDLCVETVEEMQERLKPPVLKPLRPQSANAAARIVVKQDHITKIPIEEENEKLPSDVEWAHWRQSRVPPQSPFLRSKQFVIPAPSLLIPSGYDIAPQRNKVPEAKFVKGVDKSLEFNAGMRVTRTPILTSKKTVPRKTLLDKQREAEAALQSMKEPSDGVRLAKHVLKDFLMKSASPADSERCGEEQVTKADVAPQQHARPLRVNGGPDQYVCRDASLKAKLQFRLRSAQRLWQSKPPVTPF